jgi:hypothetical protein
MNISDIKDKDIRELAELRRSEQPEYGEGFDRNDIFYAFSWQRSPEGHDFWSDIYYGNFTPYYSKYPNHEWRQPTFQRGEEVEVRNSEYEDWEPRIFLAEIKGAIYPFQAIVHSHRDRIKTGEAFALSSWKYCRKIEQPTILTLQMIADKFNLPVDKIKVEGYEAGLRLFDPFL